MHWLLQGASAQFALTRNETNDSTKGTCRKAEPSIIWHHLLLQEFLVIYRCLRLPQLVAVAANPYIPLPDMRAYHASAVETSEKHRNALYEYIRRTCGRRNCFAFLSRRRRRQYPVSSALALHSRRQGETSSDRHARTHARMVGGESLLSYENHYAMIYAAGMASTY